MAGRRHQGHPNTPPPWDQKQIPIGLLVLHVLDGNEMGKVPILKLQEKWEIMYVWIIIGKLPKQGPSPHSSTQGESANPYWPQAHNQRDKNILEATKAAPILWQVTCQVIFKPDDLEFSPSVTADELRWTALPTGADTTLEDHALTNTAALNTTTPESVGSGKQIKARMNNGRSWH